MYVYIDEQHNTFLFLSSGITCPVPPPSLENGEFTLSNNNIVGSIATYTCNGGYRFSTTTSTRTCQRNETWSMEDIQCEKGWKHLLVLYVQRKLFHFSMYSIPEDDGNDDKLSGGAIAGIVIGSVVALVVLAVLVVILLAFLWMRHENRSGKYKPSFDTEGLYFIGIYILGEKFNRFQYSSLPQTRLQRSTRMILVSLCW